MSTRSGLAVQLPYGRRIDTGLMVHILVAKNGIGCECVCPKCGGLLVAKQGEDRRWHFAHKGESNCSGGRETALHQRAKEIIAQAGYLFTPPLIAKLPDGRSGDVVQGARRVTLADVSIEDRSRPGIVPDVLAQVDGEPLIIEIHVFHLVDKAKQALIRSLGIRAVEIHLSGYRDDVSYRDAVLRTAARAWLFHPRQAAADADMEWQLVQRSQKNAEADERRRADQAETERLAEQARHHAMMPIVVWAENYYPDRATPPPRLVHLRRDDVVWLFERTTTRKAHLALVDQPAIRNILEIQGPELAKVLHENWKRLA